MNISDFKIGQKVQYIGRNCEDLITGAFGTVIGVDGDVAVRFDKKINIGHDLNGRCENGYGRWFYISDDDIDNINNLRIIKVVKAETQKLFDQLFE